MNDCKKRETLSYEEREKRVRRKLRKLEYRLVRNVQFGILGYLITDSKDVSVAGEHMSLDAVEKFVAEDEK